jgi:hypothetical protein
MIITSSADFHAFSVSGCTRHRISSGRPSGSLSSPDSISGVIDIYETIFHCREPWKPGKLIIIEHHGQVPTGSLFLNRLNIITTHVENVLPALLAHL